LRWILSSFARVYLFTETHFPPCPSPCVVPRIIKGPTAKALFVVDSQLPFPSLPFFAAPFFLSSSFSILSDPACLISQLSRQVEVAFQVRLRGAAGSPPVLRTLLVFSPFSFTRPLPGIFLFFMPVNPLTVEEEREVTLNSVSLYCRRGFLSATCFYSFFSGLFCESNSFALKSTFLYFAPCFPSFRSSFFRCLYHSSRSGRRRLT